LDLTGPSFVVAAIIVAVALLVVVAGWVISGAAFVLAVNAAIHFVKGSFHWVHYLLGGRDPELPDARSESVEPVVSRVPPVRRDPAVRAQAARVMAHRRRRSRLVFGVLLLCAVLIGLAAVGYNAWLNVLAERRVIRVTHSISEGAANLPEMLTTQMTLVAEEPGNAGLPCTVKLTWIESGSSRYLNRVIHSPDRLSIRDLAFSDGIRESPHYGDFPVTLVTKGCQPWHVESSG
jgi:type IV secretory pathway VirB3-like protein